jgi:hypothetical protein
VSSEQAQVAAAREECSRKISEYRDSAAREIQSLRDDAAATQQTLNRLGIERAELNQQLTKLQSDLTAARRAADEVGSCCIE